MGKGYGFYPAYRKYSERLREKGTGTEKETDGASLCETLEGLPAGVLDGYSKKPVKCWRKENSWLIETEEGQFLVREYKGSLAQLGKILRWQESLVNQEYPAILPLVKMQNGHTYLADGDRLFYMAEMPQGSELFDGRNEKDLLLAARFIAKAHLLGKGLVPDGENSPFVSWARAMQDRLSDLLTYRHFLRESPPVTDFERIFAENFDFFYSQGQDALQNMVIAKCGRFSRGQNTMLINSFLARDIYRTGGRVIFANLEKSDVGPGIYDLALLINSYLPLYSWDYNVLNRVIASYEEEDALDCGEKHLLTTLLRFPGRFWLYVHNYFARVSQAETLTQKLKEYVCELFWRDKCLDALEEAWKKGEEA